MSNQNEQQEKLLQRLNELQAKQAWLTSEVTSLKNEIQGLDFTKSDSNREVIDTPIQVQPVANQEIKQQRYKESILTRGIKTIFPKGVKKDIERLIGENIISVIGVIILIIGIGIGVKYAIDNQMLSPLTRIITGYLVAISLLILAIKLKVKYENYSAVLLSGALAIMYFLTYAAYDFYDLIPKLMAFGLMVVFTMFTTFASIKYNKQIIAHIGFVGAYAVPFLLSDGSGSAVMLFSYITIINLGILAVSLKNYWKSLYYTAFGFTWIIYLAVYNDALTATDDFGLLLSFLIIFFLTFYSVFIGYKLIQKELFLKTDIILLLANSFIFYGLGYEIFSENSEVEIYLGLFTLLNAVIHFGVASYIKKQGLADKNLFYLVIGLVLTYITLTIPVQLNGHWVTLLWIAEATLLFWIGRSKQIKVYEKLSYPLMALALFSVLQDWEVAYGHVYVDQPENWLAPFFNIQFLSSILVVIGFAVITFYNQKIEADSLIFSKKEFNKILQFVIPLVFLGLLYMTFSLEIQNYWDQAYYNSSVMVAYENGSSELYPEYNEAIRKLGGIWSIIYMLFFFTLLSIVNYKKLKNRLLGIVNLGANAFALVIFLLTGLYLISQLRSAYLTQDMAEYFAIGWFYIGIRYVAIAFVVGLVYTSYQYIKQEFLQVDLRQVFALVFYSTVLWLLSSELIHWMDFAGSTQSYKLGLSILWGVYSLILIVIGIFRKYKQVRIGAMGLFGITLAKLFLYDISHLNTISKTIVFVILGMLLLIISFLYNKYKKIIFDDVEIEK